MIVKPIVLATVFVGFPVVSFATDWDNHTVYLETKAGDQIEIATLSGDSRGYSVTMTDSAFSDHFLSMRPFKCVDGPEKTWCHVPYPYAINRTTESDFIDLEYDFLFVWKGKTEYGINMWNGVYYVIEPQDDGFVGHMHEINMDILAVPPDEGVLRPVRAVDLEETDPESHWLPILRIKK